jgi:hypothetical protein
MKTLQDLSQELNLTPQQADGIKEYLSHLVIDLLEGLRDENIKNFDETIESLKNIR